MKQWSRSNMSDEQKSLKEQLKERLAQLRRKDEVEVDENDTAIWEPINKQDESILPR